MPPYYFSAIADIHKYMYVLVARNFDLFVDECKLHECKLHYVITKQTVNHYDCMCIQKRANRAIQTSYYLLLGWFSCITCAAAKDKLHRRNFGLSQKLCA